MPDFELDTKIALQTDSLHKSYKDIEALMDVSLSITSGVTAILGQNGAGKTTLIKCALGLEHPSHGRVEVFGETPNKRSAREHIGVMLQDTELPDLLTGRELLTQFASYYKNPMTSDAAISLAEIGGFADKRYSKLSGGQKRRIQFALSIIGDPELVFLDEPTTGLDIDARKTLWNVVRAFVKDGRSIVLTTHYLEEADALADRIVILADGRIIADGPADQIRRSVSGAVIRCDTHLAPDEIGSLPACTEITTSGRMAEIRTSDTLATLRALLAKDPALRDLTISKPRLDDIFEALTK